MKTSHNRKKLLVVFAATGVILGFGVVGWFKLPLWRDTIIRSDENAVLVMASGEEYPTNRWFLRDEAFQFSQLQTQKDDGSGLIHYIVQNYDESAKARLRIGNTEYLAILDGSRWSSSSDNAEYFVRPERQTNQVGRDAAHNH